ncbi:hypothetical protein ACVWZ4_002861 [Bradyrhizobium sp. USDA 4472]
MSENAQQARRNAFATDAFSKGAARNLELGDELIVNAVDALVDANVMPCDLADNSDALAVDGAAILMAIGSRQTEAASILRVTRRLSTMPFEFEIGDPAEPVADRFDLFPEQAAYSFGSDLAAVLKNMWQAARGTTKKLKGVSITMAWSDERASHLFGAIEQGKGGRQRIYSSEASQWPTGSDTPFGGIIYSPKALLRFAAHLDATMAGTAASLDEVVALHDRRP